MSISPPPSPDVTPWTRRSSAELTIREMISGDQRLNIFASAWRADLNEAVVLITARDEGAREAAQTLLKKVAYADWTDGWRQLDLGDALIELRPERTSA